MVRPGISRTAEPISGHSGPGHPCRFRFDIENRADGYGSRFAHAARPGAVHQDLEEPRLQRAAALEAMDALQHAEPRFLHHFLGHAAVGHVKPRQPYQAAVVAVHQARERPLVLLAQTFQQRALFIGNYSCWLGTVVGRTVGHIGTTCIHRASCWLTHLSPPARSLSAGPTWRSLAGLDVRVAFGIQKIFDDVTNRRGNGLQQRQSALALPQLEGADLLRVLPGLAAL